MAEIIKPEVISPEQAEKEQSALVKYYAGVPEVKITRSLGITHNRLGKLIESHTREFFKERKEKLRQAFYFKAWSLVTNILDVVDDNIKANPEGLTVKNASVLLKTLLEHLNLAEEREGKTFSYSEKKELKVSDIPGDALDKLIEMARSKKERE